MRGLRAQRVEDLPAAEWKHERRADSPELAARPVLHRVVDVRQTGQSVASCGRPDVDIRYRNVVDLSVALFEELLRVLVWPGRGQSPPTILPRSRGSPHGQVP